LYSRTTALERYAGTIADYELTQYGCIDVIRAVLESSKDIHTIFELVDLRNQKRNSKKDAFALEDLLKLFVEHFVTMNAWEDDVIKSLARAQASDGTIGETFGHLFFGMMGGSSSFDFRMPAAELLEIFSEKEPDKADVFEQIILEQEETCREQIRKLEEVLQKKLEACGEDLEPPHTEVKTLSDFIENEVEHQKPKFAEEEQAARQAGEWIGESMLVAEKNKFFGSSETVPALLEQLTSLAKKEGFVLDEKTWRKIDKISDVFLLKLLILQTFALDDTQSVRRWARLFFEKTSLWPFLVEGGKVGIRKA